MSGKAMLPAMYLFLLVVISASFALLTDFGILYAVVQTGIALALAEWTRRLACAAASAHRSAGRGWFVGTPVLLFSAIVFGGFCAEAEDRQGIEDAEARLATAAAERAELQGRLDVVSAERDHYREALSATHDYWAARDVCEARLLAAGEETRDEVIGLFAAPELQRCHDEQKAEVGRLTTDRKE